MVGELGGVQANIISSNLIESYYLCRQQELKRVGNDPDGL